MKKQITFSELPDNAQKLVLIFTRQIENTSWKEVDGAFYIDDENYKVELYTHDIIFVFDSFGQFLGIVNIKE